MHKKKFIYLLIILLLTTSYWLYNKYISKSADLPCSIEIAKRDFIAFPIKENESKIYSLTKDFTDSLPQNKINENKGKKTEQEIIENSSETNESLITNVPLVEKAIEVPTLDTVLRLNDSGDKVKYIQHRLNEYGYPVEEDGIFKARTYDAILNFQYRCGLDIDGIVGSKTIEKLNITPDENTEFNTSKPVFSINEHSTANIALKDYKSANELELSINSAKVTSETNFYIDVDLSNQRVNIFIKSMDKWILDKSFICSSGKASTPTVKGNFTIKDKGPMFRAGSNTICNYYTRFYGNYLFHTVLLDNDENIQDGRLGIPLSHGCIRLAIDDAKYIYCNIPYGTSVAIH